MANQNILVTGAAGFIGFHLSKRLCEEGNTVFGIDNLNEYYDINLKHARLNVLKGQDNFVFERIDLLEKNRLSDLIEKNQIKIVINLAAQAGVRYSLENPQAYIDSNINGFANVLECCRIHGIEHLIYASSSSVYGANKKIPFSESDNVDHPLSLYAASKKSNELMAHAYASLYKLPVTGLRFFSVYGPYGRPDMALFLFTKAIVEGNPIKVFNNGNLKRDFTYVDDIVEGMVKLIPMIPKGKENWDGVKTDPKSSFAPYQLFNIGNNEPIDLMEFIETIENHLGKKAQKEYLPMQPGDVNETYADVNDLISKTGFEPRTPLSIGVKNFIDWYLEFYKHQNSL